MRDRQKGIALITAMMLATFLFVTGLGFLYFMERDSHQQLRQERAIRAQYAARSGLDYFYFRDIEDPSTFTSGVVNGPFELEPGEYFEVTKMSDGGCRSRGWVEDSSGRVRAQRVLVAPGGIPGGDRVGVYDESF